MPMEWDREGENLLLYKISGDLSIAEMEAAAVQTDKVLGDRVDWKVLATLDGFTGWTKEPGWEHSMLFEETDEAVERIAVVGPKEWRDQVEMFMLKGMRPVEIEYFSDEEQARSWLGVVPRP
jgi:hypothetical protein